MTLDQRSHEVFRAGEPVHLAPKEYAVLELLMSHAGTVLTRDAIMRQVWDYSFDGDSNVVETSIKRVRRVIDAGRTAPLIRTVRAEVDGHRAPIDGQPRAGQRVLPAPTDSVR